MNGMWRRLRLSNDRLGMDIELVEGDERVWITVGFLQDALAYEKVKMPKSHHRVIWRVILRRIGMVWSGLDTIVVVLLNRWVVVRGVIHFCLATGTQRKRARKMEAKEQTE